MRPATRAAVIVSPSRWFSPLPAAVCPASSSGGDADAAAVVDMGS